MEGTSFLGNKMWFVYGGCIFLSALIIGFGSYKGKRMSEIRLLDKQIAVYEKNVSEMNQIEISGLQTQ